MECTVIGIAKAMTVVAITMAGRGVQKTIQQCVSRKLVLMDPITVAHQIAKNAKKIPVVLGYVIVVWITVLYISVLIDGVKI